MPSGWHGNALPPQSGGSVNDSKAGRLICEPFVSRASYIRRLRFSVVFIPPWLMPLVAPRNLVPEGGAFTQSASQGSF